MEAVRSSTQLQVLVPPPPFDCRKFRQSFGCSGFVGIRVHAFPPLCSDPAPAAHEHHVAEQVALDHKGVEAVHVGFGIDPPQDEHLLVVETVSSTARPGSHDQSNYRADHQGSGNTDADDPSEDGGLGEHRHHSLLLHGSR